MAMVRRLRLYNKKVATWRVQYMVARGRAMLRRLVQAGWRYSCGHGETGATGKPQAQARRH